MGRLEEMEAAVDRMRMTDEERAALKNQLRRGRQGARFTVYAWMKREEGKENGR